MPSIMEKTVVLNVVGLTPRLIGEHTPNISAFQRRGKMARVSPTLPAVTCTVQATYLTGALPREHGIVGNGWYFRDDCEIKFWRQSNKLVQRPKVWDLASEIDPSFTCANMFWWYNMYSSANYSLTPRPMYPADGRKLPDVYSVPGELRDELQARLGQFPLFKYWGPGAALDSSRWIADATLDVDTRFDPTLSLVYLPHLDYCLQKYGPGAPQIAAELRAIDGIVGDLIRHYEQRETSVILLSEYGITPVSRPVHINRTLRRHGLVAVREELGRELLDPGASTAFAVADHQIAHVYVNDRRMLGAVQALLEVTPGVGQVLGEEGKRAHGLDHPRAGDLVLIAAPDAWFSYYYWLDDEKAPDFARTVDIHRKPGYDPAELFIDPALRFPKLKLGWTLLQKKLGFRYLMDVIPLDAALVRGSHGHRGADPLDGPLLMTNRPQLLDTGDLAATEVCEAMLRHLFPRRRDAALTGDTIPARRYERLAR
jgi:predicted AlkP superfamily pyrophosphatase or phosphodiesterase